MHFNHRHLAAFIAVFAAHDVYSNVLLTRVTRRFRKSIEDNAEAREKMAEQIKYLCHLLEENDVPLDKFDEIALLYRTTQN